MHYIIGSGPAGTAAAVALLERGLTVTMLDAGGTLEPEQAARVAELRGSTPEQWSVEQRAALYGPLRYNAEGAPLKLAFGSDYVYRDVERWQPVRAVGVDAYRSLAMGGMSVLWGAAVMPFSDADFVDWPIGAADLGEHYAAVLRMTGLAADRDALDALYPLHVEPHAPFPIGRQAQAILTRAERHRQTLDPQHVHVGKARLAFGGAGAGCVRCGMCLYGCPYGVIYSTEDTVRRLQVAYASRFAYVPGVIVQCVEESGGGVTIEAIQRDTQAPRRFGGDRVYVAAGALASTAIILRSLHQAGVAVTLRQSDHFLIPMLLMGSTGRASEERLHTLSQLFIELTDPAMSRRGVHLQVYTYNDLYERMARQRCGTLYNWAKPFAARVIDRLALVKGYLHSDESDAIRATLENNGESVLRLEAIANSNSRRTMDSVARVLRRNASRLGAWPVRFAMRKGLPGSSVHVGGSFPMRRDPSGLDSDLLGRPAHLRRVHLVDASVFPNMPAASPTLTIMANARRIVLASQGDEERAA